MLQRHCTSRTSWERSYTTRSASKYTLTAHQAKARQHALACPSEPNTSSSNTCSYNTSFTTASFPYTKSTPNTIRQTYLQNMCNEKCFNGTYMLRAYVRQTTEENPATAVSHTSIRTQQVYTYLQPTWLSISCTRMSTLRVTWSLWYSLARTWSLHLSLHHSPQGLHDGFHFSSFCSTSFAAIHFAVRAVQFLGTNPRCRKYRKVNTTCAMELQPWLCVEPVHSFGCTTCSGQTSGRSGTCGFDHGITSCRHGIVQIFASWCTAWIAAVHSSVHHTRERKFRWEWKSWLTGYTGQATGQDFRIYSSSYTARSYTRDRLGHILIYNGDELYKAEFVKYMVGYCYSSFTTVSDYMRVTLHGYIHLTQFWLQDVCTSTRHYVFFDRCTGFSKARFCTDDWCHTWFNTVQLYNDSFNVCEVHVAVEAGC